jgi:imidazolonepropionase-like amidohydrolase
MKLTVTAALLCGIACVTSSGGPPQEPPAGKPTTAFVHVAVVPMDAPRVARLQTVVVRGDRILAVGPDDETPAPAGAVVIDGRGKFLAPGLADMHVHVGGESFFTLFLANGVTTVRNMWGTQEHVRWRERIRSGAILGPALYTAGPLLDGDPPIWDGSAVVTDEASGVAAVTAQTSAGYDFAKVYNNLTPQAYDGIVAEARRRGVPVAGHVPDAVGLERVLAARQDTIEHLGGYFRAAQRSDSPLLGKLDLRSSRHLVDYVNDDKLSDLVRRTAAAGSWNCVTLFVFTRFAPLEESRPWRERPELRYLPPLLRASWDPTRDFRMKDNTPDDWAAIRRGDARRLRLTAALHAAGAGILLGTDTANPFVVPGFSIHEELALLVAAGLTPYEALRAGTADAAAYLHADFGVVAPGRRADLVLLEANPLDEVTNMKKLAGVMLAGRWLPRADLDARLESIAKRWTGDVDRFAQAPALADPGTSAAQERRARSFWNGVAAGQERFSTQVAPDGGVVLQAQAITDGDEPGENDTVWRAEYDDAARLRRVRLRTANHTASVEVALAMDGGRLRGDVRTADGRTTAIDEASASDVLLDLPSPLASAPFDAPPLGFLQLIADRAGHVAGRSGVVFRAKAIEVEPSVRLSDVTYSVKRVAKPGGGASVVIDRAGAGARWSGSLVLDAAGLIASARLDQQMGTVEYRR